MLSIKAKEMNGETEIVIIVGYFHPLFSKKKKTRKDIEDLETQFTISILDLWDIFISKSSNMYFFQVH